MTDHDAINDAIREAIGRPPTPDDAAGAEDPVATDFDSGVRATPPSPPDMNDQIRAAAGRARYPHAASRSHAMHDAAPLPPRIAHPKIEKAAAEYRRLTAELRTTDQRLADLVNGRHVAEEQDLNARAAAVRTGKPDPGTAHTAQLDAEVAEVDGRARALRRAVEQSYADLLDVFEAHRDELAARDDAAIRAAREATAALVEQLADAYAAQRRAEAARAWAEGFPSRSRWSPGLGTVPGLVAQSGEDMGAEVVLAALRKLADPDPPKQAFVMGGQPWVSTGVAA